MLGYSDYLCSKIPICTGNTTYQLQTIKSIYNTLFVCGLFCLILVWGLHLFNIVNVCRHMMVYQLIIPFKFSIILLFIF